jgi:Acetyltransferases
MIVRKIKIEEIYKLSPLFQVTNQEVFMNNRADKIKRRVLDIYVLEENNRVIAEVTIVYDEKHYEDYTIPNQRVYVEALRVLPEYQGKGLGTYFLREVINQVRAEGYAEMTIGVEDDNLKAKHIYRKLGFTEFIRRDAGSFEGDYYEYDVSMKRL